MGQLPFPYPPLGSWAPLPVWAQLAQPRGCPGPLENTWSHWAVMAHAMGPPLPIGAAKLPPFLAILLPHPVLSTCFQDPMVPWRPLPGQSPKPLGRSQSPLNRRHLSIHPTAKNKLSSGMCETPTPNCQDLLLSQLYENWGATEQTRKESVCPSRVSMWGGNCSNNCVSSDCTYRRKVRVCVCMCVTRHARVRDGVCACLRWCG